MKFLIVLVAISALIYSEAKPANYEIAEFGGDIAERNDFGVDDDGLGIFSARSDVSDCHGISCPSGTVACSKTVKTSSDKRTLLTTVQCEDIQGNVLNSEIKSSENPFENTQISSFSFTGHYNYQGGNAVGVTPKSTYHNTYYNNQNNNNNNDDDDVEVF